MRRRAPKKLPLDGLRPSWAWRSGPIGRARTNCALPAIVPLPNNDHGRHRPAGNGCRHRRREHPSGLSGRPCQYIDHQRPGDASSRAILNRKGHEVVPCRPELVRCVHSIGSGTIAEFPPVAKVLRGVVDVAGSKCIEDHRFAHPGRGTVRPHSDRRKRVVHGDHERDGRAPVPQVVLNGQGDRIYTMARVTVQGLRGI